MLDTKLQSEEYKFYFLFFLALTFVFSMLAPISYSDLGVWIAEGRQIMQQGTLYIHDAYSFNLTEMHPYPWLSSLFYYFLDTNFAVESILILHRLIPVLIVAFWLTRYPALMEKKSLISLVIGISGMGMLIVDRPALIVLPLIPYFYELIENGEIYKNKIKSLLLLILWTNLHGSFALIFILLGYKMAIQAVKTPKQAFKREQILFFVYAFMATLINPWGLQIYKYILLTARISKSRVIAEWLPLYVRNTEFNSELTLFLATVFLVIGLVIYKQKLSSFASSLFPIFIFSSVMALRNLPLFFIVLPLFWGRYLTNAMNVSGFVAQANKLKVLIHRLVVIALVLVGIYMFTSYSDTIRPMLSKHYANRFDNTSSFRIAEYLRNSTDKKIFNDWLIGSFLMFSQDNKIFIDARNIIYDDKIFGDYTKIIHNTDGQAEKLLADYQVDYVVSDKVFALTNLLKSSTHWTFILEDNGYSLFEKK